ncbi:CAP domain-containing protein [Nonomuraea sp. NPDC050404]|uniref:CAP domain-containing protein n=1 Tax=Nonomuraea sp. NPDC050404 TaxID=3155783 RepID=UPI0033EF22A9
MNRTIRSLEVAAVAGTIAIGVPAVSTAANASSAVANASSAVANASSAVANASSAAASCSAAAAYYDAAPTSANLAMIRTAVYCLIDAERAKVGLRPLTRTASLESAAISHAAAAASIRWWTPGANSHNNPRTGSTPHSRITAAGYCPNPVSWAYAETTYTGWGGGGTPRAAVNWWVNVSTYGHRQIVLSPTLTDDGVGAAVGSANPAGGSGGGTYVVDFGRCQR